MSNSASFRGLTLRAAVLLTGARVTCSATDTPPPPVAPPPPASAPAVSPVDAEKRGFLGVVVSEIQANVRAQVDVPDGEGLAVGMVQGDSPAAKAGLQTHDLLLRFGDQRLVSPGQFVTLVENAGAGSEVEIVWLRRGAEQKSRLTLAKRPPAAPDLPPDPAQLARKLNEVVQILQDNPAALNAVHRILTGGGAPPQSAPEATENTSGAVRMLRKDTEGTVELLMSDGESRLRACDAAGRQIFEGPFTTEADRAAAPAEIRKKGELLETQSAPALPPEVLKIMPSAPARR